MPEGNDLEPLLNRMHRIIRKADPALARALVAERMEAPNDPSGLAHLGRLLLALTDVPAGRNTAGRRLWKSLLRSAVRMRLMSAKR